MDELFLKMHEEAMDLQKTVTEMKCILTNLQDAIELEEIDRAGCKYMSRRDVESASVDCKTLRRIIGLGPDICRAAEEILKQKENAEEVEDE